MAFEGKVINVGAEDFTANNLKLRRIIMKDNTGEISIAAWEKDIEKIEIMKLGENYHLEHLKVKNKGNKFECLTLTKQITISTITNSESLDNVILDEDEVAIGEIENFVVSNIYICQLCKKVLTDIKKGATVFKCEGDDCNRKQRVTKGQFKSHVTIDIRTTSNSIIRNLKIRLNEETQMIPSQLLKHFEIENDATMDEKLFGYKLRVTYNRKNVTKITFEE